MSKFLKSSSIYLFSSIVSAAIPFMLLPVLTRYLTPSEYGQIAMFTIFTGALVALIGLSVPGAANRRYFDEEVNDFELARFNGNCFIILFVTTLLSLIVLSAIDTYLAKYLGVSTLWIYLGVISVFGSFILNLRLGQWQVRGQAKKYGVLQVINSIIVLLLSLLFVIEADFGADGRIYGIVVTAVIIGCIAYFTLVTDKLVLLKFNRDDIKEALSFGIPLIPHVLGGFLLLSVDRLIVNKELGLNMTGIYMVAVSVGSALNIIFNSINKAYSPWLFAKLKEDNEEEKRSIVKKTYQYFIFLICIALLSFAVAPPLLKFIVGPEFHQAADLLPLIILGQVFFGMYFMVTNYIFYVKKTKYLSYVTISSGLINVVLLLILIPLYGLYGAAAAFCIANVFRFLATWGLSGYLYDMPWHLSKQ